MKLSDKTYDMLRWIARIGLLALMTLYVAVAGIWKFPCAKEVAETISAVDLLLDALLGIDSMKYYEEKQFVI